MNVNFTTHEMLQIHQLPITIFELSGKWNFTIGNGNYMCGLPTKEEALKRCEKRVNEILIDASYRFFKSIYRREGIPYRKGHLITNPQKIKAK